MGAHCGLTRETYGHPRLIYVAGSDLGNGSQHPGADVLANEESGLLR